MTRNQIRKLEKAMELIHDSMEYEKITKPETIKIWIRAAAGYCREVVDEIVDV